MGTENKQKCDGCVNNANPSDQTNPEVTNQNKDVCFVPVTVDENDVLEGARKILKLIRTDWKLKNVDYKLFTDGITNKLVGCFHNVKDEDISSYANTNQNSNHDVNNLLDTLSNNVVLIRVYGNKTDLLIDRKAETRNIKLLHSYGFAPALFAVFNNGLAYEYVPGKTLTPETVIKPEIFNLVAERMAEMHKVECGSETVKEPMLWRKTQKFLDLIPEKFSNPEIHKRVEKMFLPVSKLREEFTNLYRRLEKHGSPIVFSHNDLLLGNIIYTESLNRVTFIDYEYAENNFQAFDIGNHFTEFAGIDDIDYSRYPSKDFQIQWLTTYLKTYLETDDINEEDVEKLYVQVNQFALASHFFWAIWALIQAEHSTINFDFVKFAQTRYNEYLAKKDTFLSLKFEGA